MAEHVKVRLLREPEPPRPDGSPVRFGLQDRTGAMHDGLPRADGLGQFDFELIVAGDPDRGPPDFGGPFVSGSKGERFVYLSWQRLDGAGFMNRIKVRLKDIDWPLIQSAQVKGRRLEASLYGVATGGGNRPIEWALAD